jgi:hypothetical protein
MVLHEQAAALVRAAIIASKTRRYYMGPAVFA